MATCEVDVKEKNLVVKQLNELFGNTVNLELIESVALNFQYDVCASSNHLIELSSGFLMEQEPSVLNNQTYGNSSGYIPTQTVFVPSNNQPPTKSKKEIEIDKTIAHINSGYKVLVLLRGLPGSGKSTLGKKILQETIGYDDNSLQVHILSADDYFIKNGTYDYNSTLISDAHGWNHNRAFRAMSKGVSPVIIDNTNTQLWEMKPYAVMATDYGYIIDILEPATHWCFNEKELFKRNRHGVSKDRIKSMLERYERGITTPKLLGAYKLYYKQQKPPEIRLYPPPNKTNYLHSPTTSVTSTLTSRDAVELLSSNNFSIGNERNELTSNDMFLTTFAGNNNVVDTLPRENINLMDFNEGTKATSSTPSVEIGYSRTETSLDAMDTMLMHQDEGNIVYNSKLLQPEKKTQGSNECRSSNPIPDLSAWGIDEQAIRSWDIVTPLADIKSDYVDLTEDNKAVVETTESSSLTEDRVFSLLRNSQYPLDCVKILQTQNRDINRNLPVKLQGIQKKLMLDKSCLTEDIYEDREIHIEQLTSLFPQIPTRHLNYWYDKCKGDMDWTIELILASKEELLNVSIDNDNEVQLLSSDSDNTRVVVDSDSGNSNNSEKEVTKLVKNKRKTRNSSSDEKLKLKKCIENKVNIGDDWYSSHLLRIKQIRFGNNDTESQPSTSTSEHAILDAPSTSTAVNNAGNSSRMESYNTNAGKVFIVDSDIEFDDLDLENNMEVEGKEMEVETMELNLGEFFVQQLEGNFGDSGLTYPKGFQPVVQVPVTLAKQLYTFYIESVFQQLEAQNAVMENLIKEDEEFARKLQDEENSPPVKEAQETPQLQNIMEEQAKLSKIQKEVDKWKDLTPDTLAARLTRDKLFSVFPRINRDILIEILQAHDNKYEDTVETLLASTTPDNVIGSPETVRKPPLDEGVIKEMREAQKYYSKDKDEDQSQSAPQSATYYRELANKYLKKRTELYGKAQRYHQRGMTAVAQFYSGLASKQTDYYDRANNMAATTFLDEHAERLKDFNTLDLHYLYVKEAIPALDVFLDRNINLLRFSQTKQAEYLQIITGRGRRSENGVPKIRPVVSARLKKRNIICQQLNPGLLKIKITKNTLLTSEL